MRRTDLSARKLVKERAGSGSRPEETVDLKGNDGPRVEAEGAGVLGKVGQQVVRVEEADHGDPGGDIDGINIVAVDEGTETVEHLGGGQLLPVVMRVMAAASPHVRLLDDDARRVSAHAGQGLPQMIAQDGSFRLGQAGHLVGLRRDADAVRVEIDEPHIVRQAEVFLVLEKGARDADDVGRGGEEELLGAAHGGGQERNDGEHVLERIEHGDEGQHGHGQGVVVPRLEDHLVLEHDEGEHFEARVHAEELERQVEREVDHVEAGVVRQGEDERRRAEGAGQDVQLDAGLARDGHGSAQEAEDPRLDVAHVVHHHGRRRLRHLARQEAPDGVAEGEPRGAEPLGRRVFVAGVDQLLEDDKALAEQREERVVREEAQRRHVLIAESLLDINF